MMNRSSNLSKWLLLLVISTLALSLAVVVSAAGADVQINSDLPGSVQNEIRITQNATNSANLVVAYNDNVGTSSPNPLGVSFSTDTGQTWTDRQLNVPFDPNTGLALGFIFDPYISSDATGNIFAGYIASDGVPGNSGNYIERSTDGGSTWSGPTTIAFDTAPVPGPNDPLYRFNDRPEMTVDSGDNVYVTWIKDVGYNMLAPTSDIYFAKSPPAVAATIPFTSGLNFTGTVAGSVAPQIVNDCSAGPPLPPPPCTKGDLANVPDIEVAPNGTVYVAWISVTVNIQSSKPADLMIDQSTDGGVTFGTDSTVAKITALANNMTTASGAIDARSGSYPVIGINPANSQHIYMAYAAVPTTPGDEADIFFIRSTNGGGAWSSPLTVNDDNTTNDQIHPAMDIKADGTIDLVWYDKRNSANDDQWDVYFARSTDGGLSFGANRRISDQSFASPTDAFGSPWMGEYLGIVVDSTNAYIAFTSSSTDTRGDVFFDMERNDSTTAITLSRTGINVGQLPLYVPLAIVVLLLLATLVVFHHRLRKGER